MSMRLRNGGMGMSDLNLGAEAATLVLRCECGAMINANSEDELIQLTRLHFGEFHPDLNGHVQPDAILAMAEQLGAILSDPRQADEDAAWITQHKGDSFQ
jgi:predicted small metal-binding protein